MRIKELVKLMDQGLSICDDMVAGLEKSTMSADYDYDYHFFIINVLISIKENCIFAKNGIKKSNAFEVALHCRVLIEVWANLHYVLKDRSVEKTERYIKKISRSSQEYFNAIIDPSIGEKVLAELSKVPRWTRSGIVQRVELLSETAVMEYEILSRFTHADCWVRLNEISDDEQSPVITVNILTEWLIESMNHIFYWLSITDKVGFITRLRILRFRYDVENKIDRGL